MKKIVKRITRKPLRKVLRMNTGFKSQCLPTYRILTEDQIQRIHYATLELLETVGVKVIHPEAIEMMSAAGCRIKVDNSV